MKKFIYLLALMGFASASVQASTFNFAAYADGNTAGSTAITGLGEAGYTSFSATNGGITVTATGSHTTDTEVFAYLDSGSAGLGVCQTLTWGNQCLDSADDNVTSNETLTLTFSEEIALTGLTLLNAGHDTTFGVDDKFQIRVDGNLSGLLTLETLPLVAGSYFGTTFDFINIGGAEFYINTMTVSAVPVPAAGILFASALFGAGVFGRRKKKAKASVVGAFARAS